MRRSTALVAFALFVGACAGTTEPVTSPTVSTSPTTTTTTPATTTTTTFPTTTAPAVSEAPWAGSAIADVPPVLIDQWEAADNKYWCSALYPTFSNDPAAVIRKANYSGGWAVAWDLPSGPGREASGAYCADCGRGAYGIAGTGVPAEIDLAQRWANQLSWDDGSIAGYGYEGDADPSSHAPLLMYLLVNGEGCLYNIWSFLGESHLLDFVDSLRRVDGLEGVRTAWQSQPEVEEMGAPPWDEVPLAVSDVPDVEVVEWEQDAGAPASCPMLAFADLGAADGATARRASNAGEMLVAWDLPSGPGHDAAGYPCADCGRGVVGLGTFRSPTDESLPIAFAWDDGSVARLRLGAFSYGAEALLSVQGFDCTYWVWSHLGEDNLKFLLSQLRRVEGMP